MNCVVEKRRAEEIVDHQPRTIRLPFGVNVTTDPRYEHVSGEKMAIYCESGKDQRHMPMEMMATPVVVPLPGPIHLPLQFHGAMQQPHQSRVPVSVNQADQPAVGLVPPPPNHVQQVPLPIALPMHHMQLLPGQNHAAVQVTETRDERPPSPDQVPVQVETREGRILHRIPIQVEGHEGRTFQQIPIQVTTHEGRAFSRRPFPVQVETHEGRVFPHPPEPIQEETREGHAFQPVQSEGREGRAFQHQHIPLHMVESRGFNPDAAAAAAAVMHASEGRVFHQQSPALEMVSHQQLPVHIPVPMMQQIQVEEQQAQPRPHYVQPRSVRSVDEVLHRRDKRVRRCACDCAC
ncbi:hypothetical protein L798_09268 [Zootermopsis nevadensis]|uniref:Uncharacterized protein n=2 Tax=Zootermopsis nevadensis TaxID=136037 RepID=A0A067R1G0_ZOONE|nr:hypothetical protein L798_09268 [Zootermopsis nevadensis]